MPNNCYRILLGIVSCYLIATRGYCQDTTTNANKDSSITLSPKQLNQYTNSINKKAEVITDKLAKTNDNVNVLKDSQQQEIGLQQLLAKVYIKLAKQLFESSKQPFAALYSKVNSRKGKLNEPQHFIGGNKEHLPLADTFTTSLKLLDNKLGSVQLRYDFLHNQNHLPSPRYCLEFVGGFNGNQKK